MRDLNRRAFLWSGAGLNTSLLIRSSLPQENVYRFAMEDCDIHMSVEFMDRYSAAGFWFREDDPKQRFCLSADGRRDAGCLQNFSGSVAIAHYKVHRPSGAPRLLGIREHVRTIDQDARLNARPPFESVIELRGGMASDIQAFGYQTNDAPRAEASDTNDPWCLLRQDLYFDNGKTPFLLVHWKHTLSAIRLLDVIPGERTKLIAEPGKENQKHR